MGCTELNRPFWDVGRGLGKRFDRRVARVLMWKAGGELFSVRSGGMVRYAPILFLAKGASPLIEG